MANAEYTVIWREYGDFFIVTDVTVEDGKEPDSVWGWVELAAREEFAYAQSAIADEDTPTADEYVQRIHDDGYDFIGTLRGPVVWVA